MKKQMKKIVDEYQLRRDLREQAKMATSTDLAQEVVTQAVKEKPQFSENIRIGGIEGGATYSTLVILDGKGVKLTEIEGPHTNHWTIGIDETAIRLSSMIERGKKTLNMPESVPLDCVGLCLSGCEEEITNRQLVDTLLQKYPNSAKDYVISSDTLGSLRTGLESGGIVLIAGTGSNALLMNPDGTTHNCGGWGHIMGDEGAAYWIAHRACKYVFDDMDGLAKAPESISYVWPAMRDYFNVTDRNALLSYFYANFEKSTISNFTKVIVAGCERNDPLCLKIFEEAGQLLAKHISALWKKASYELTSDSNGLKIICVGSVWKSGKFMEKGFVDEIFNFNVIERLKLLRLTTTSALGACYLAAEKINYPLVKSYDDNVEVFYSYNHYSEMVKRGELLKNRTVVSDNAPVHGNGEST